MKNKAHRHRVAPRVTAAAGLFSLFAAAAAHDYWIERNGGEYTVFQGHLYSSHEGEARVPYDPAIVKRATCAQAQGEVTTPEPVRAYPVRVSGPCAALFIEVASGYWAQTLTETVQKPRSEVRGALRGWLSEEAVKRIDFWIPRLARPLSDALELTPLEDPFQLKPGEKLRLLVTWRRRPQRGVAVAYDGNARGVTGADGRANVRIRHGGVQILSASFEESVHDPNADKVVRGTILQLDLPEQ